ncbi:MAG: hypothetical protein H6974_12990 [Gammaproteobacteria bacterium]|nr:hypothetical protein [Gammaproteobacteria bacterium]
MSRIRTVKPEFWTGEKIMECSREARLLFIGMWNFCDDGGVHVANLRKLRAEVFPGDDDVTLEQVGFWIQELVSHRLIVEFEAIYEDYPTRFWFVSGWDHQRIEKPYLKYPKYQKDSKNHGTVAERSTTDSRLFGDCSAQGEESKGRERKGKEGKGEEAPPAASASPVTASPDSRPASKVAKASKPSKAIKTPIPADWTPAETTYVLLEKHGIDRPFAEGCIDEFLLYWTEQQERRPGWEATFVNNVKHQWERRASAPPAVPGGGRATPGRVATKHDALVENNRRAMQEWLAAQDAQVIEGECHEVH